MDGPGVRQFYFLPVEDVQNDTALLDGKNVFDASTGVPRNKQLSIVSANASDCILLASDERRRQFPFVWGLPSLLNIGLCVSVTTLYTKSLRAMPVSIGLHPAFRWRCLMEGRGKTM
jgi:hypothetical protein